MKLPLLVASLSVSGLVLASLTLVSTVAVAEPQIQTPPERDAPAEARATLDRMARALRERDYDLAFVYIRDNQVEPMRFIHVYANGQERSRLVHLNGPAREVIRENDTVVAYFAESKPVMLDKSGSGLFARELLSDLSRIVDSYQLKMGPSLRIAGREARQVTLFSPDGERYGYRLFVDEETGLLLRSELLSESARVIEQWQVVNLSLQSPIPARDLAVGFEVNAAAGVRVLPASVAQDDRASEWVVGWLPSGFKLKSYQTQHQPADAFPIQHLLFSDGVAAISVYVAKRPEGITAAERVWRRGAMTIVEVADAAARITVVGDIPSQTAKKIAQSVRKTAELRP